MVWRKNQREGFHINYTTRFSVNIIICNIIFYGQPLLTMDKNCPYKSSSQPSWGPNSIHPCKGIAPRNGERSTQRRYEFYTQPSKMYINKMDIILLPVDTRIHPAPANKVHVFQWNLSWFLVRHDCFNCRCRNLPCCRSLFSPWMVLQQSFNNSSILQWLHLSEAPPWCDFTWRSPQNQLYQLPFWRQMIFWEKKKTAPRRFFENPNKLYRPKKIYCWWFRNPAITSWYVKYPVIYKVFSTIPGGFLAGFLNHQQYHLRLQQLPSRLPPDFQASPTGGCMGLPHRGGSTSSCNMKLSIETSLKN